MIPGKPIKTYLLELKATKTTPFNKRDALNNISVTRERAEEVARGKERGRLVERTTLENCRLSTRNTERLSRTAACVSCSPQTRAIHLLAENNEEGNCSPVLINKGVG